MSFLPAAKPRRSMDDKSPRLSVCLIYLMEAFRGQISMATWVIEVTEFDYEVRCDLRGSLEAAMASEATKMAVRGNMHIDTRVNEFADLNPGVKFEL